MLDFIIGLLQKLKERQKNSEKNIQNKATKVGEISFVLFVFFLVGFGFLSQFEEFSGFAFDFAFLKEIISFSLKIILVFYSYKVLMKNNKSLTRYLYIVFFPIYFISLFLSIDDRHIVLGTVIYLTAIYPLLYLVNIKRINKEKLDKIKKIFFVYNIGFYIFLSLNILLISIGLDFNFFGPYTYLTIEILNVDEFSALPFIFFFLTYGIYSLHHYFDVSGLSRKSVKKGTLVFISISFIVYILNLFPIAIDNFYDSRINKSQVLINKGGDNFDSYNSAKVFFLERAFYNEIKDHRALQTRDNQTFIKLFDGTPESYFGEKISEYTNNRISFETNMTKLGDKADVVLTLAELENKIFHEDKNNFPVLETTYRFHFSNESNENQEVIINFETPNKYSVISDLKLGLDLELQGQVAPRGAAAKVYQESLRKNIDPALIEKVGLSTYSLKVFPIPSVTDSKTRGKQLVELKILTPLFDLKEDIKYTPNFSFINLKFDDDSGILSKIYNHNDLIKEDIVREGDIEDYLTSEHFFKTEELKIEDNDYEKQYCIDPLIIEAFNKYNLASKELELDKISIFFDNSSSVKRNKADKYYNDIFSKIKNYGDKLNDVDLYSYNFGVDKLLESKDIKFWGYSNIDSVVDYITNNNLENRRIILITDDDSFNYESKENKTRNFNKLTSNQISVIKIGNKVKKYKSDFNNILSATSGNIYEVNNKEDIDKVLGKIFDNSKNDVNFSFKSCNIIDRDDKTDKILGGHISNLMLSTIKNQNDWEIIAREQTVLSKKYNIVNQFNSFIALQTVSQQRDLDKYKNSKNKYETIFNNYGSTTKSSNTRITSDNALFEIDSISEVLDGGDFFAESSSTQWNSMGSSSRGGIDSFSVSNTSLSSSSSHGYSDSLSFNMSGKSTLSFYGLILMIIYLIQFGSIISFIIKYKKSNPKK